MSSRAGGLTPALLQNGHCCPPSIFQFCLHLGDCTRPGWTPLSRLSPGWQGEAPEEVASPSLHPGLAPLGSDHHEPEGHGGSRKLIRERSISALVLNPKGPKTTAEEGLRTGLWDGHLSGLNKAL